MSTSYEGRVALITGITGQDGSYLTEFLLEKGYTVSRCTSVVIPDRNREPRFSTIGKNDHFS